MKKLVIALALLLVTGCATNMGPFDPRFDWKFGYGKDAPSVVITPVDPDPVVLPEVVVTPEVKPSDTRAECINSGSKWSYKYKKCRVD